MFFSTLFLFNNQLINPSAFAASPWQVNMYRGVTPISKDIYHLHMIAFWICVIIGIGVFSVMIYSLIKHRKSKGAVASHFHKNIQLEILWAVIPFLILVGLAVPATQTLMRMEDESNSEITIKIVGYQWKWLYQYLDQNISFFSNLSTPIEEIQNKQKKGKWYLLEVDKPLVLPIHKKIRFLVTSNDVIHSWWVPELGIKRDAIPGFIHEAWAKIEKPGVYRGQCAELCGINHGFMPIVVQAVSEKKFNQWVKTEQQLNQTINTSSTQSTQILTKTDLITLGKKIYDSRCAVCHKIDGQGMPPLFPALKGSSVAVGYPISRHISIVLNGVSGTAMQAFSEQLSDQEIAAIVTYERNAWENNTGDIVQPNDVTSLRAGYKKTINNKPVLTGGK